MKKQKSKDWFKIFLLLFMLIMAVSSVLNTFYLFSINTKLSLLPTMDLSGIQNTLKQIGDSLDVRVLDMFR